MQHAILGLLVLAAVASAMELTASNYAAETAGKAHFIKFQAPWCGHCKRMKPAWEQLMGEYEDASGLVIGDVDCTVHQSLCQEQGVSGYPTIKYWNDATGEDGAKYQGARDYDGLKKFVEDTFPLGPGCLVGDTTECTDKEKKYIGTWSAKSAEDVEKQTARLTGMLAKSMKKELMQWVKQRLAILKQFAEASAGHDEL